MYQGVSVVDTVRYHRIEVVTARCAKWREGNETRRASWGVWGKKQS